MSGDAPRFPAEAEGHEALGEHLHAMGLKAEPTVGNYDGPERSYIIHGPTREQLYSLGKKFGQEAVIYSHGGKHEMLYTNGPKDKHYHPSTGENEVFGNTPPDNHYTAMPGGHGHFRLGFDFNRTIPASLAPTAPIQSPAGGKVLQLRPQSSQASAGAAMAKHDTQLLQDFRGRLATRVELFKSELVSLRERELRKSLNGVNGVAAPDSGPAAQARGDAPPVADKTIAIQGAPCPMCGLADAPGACTCLAEIPQNHVPGSGLAPGEGIAASPCPLCQQPEQTCACLQKSGEAFAHLTHQLEGKGNVSDPKALAATIGRKTLGVKEMARRAAAGRKVAKGDHLNDGATPAGSTTLALAEDPMKKGMGGAIGQDPSADFIGKGEEKLSKCASCGLEKSLCKCMGKGGVYEENLREEQTVPLPPKDPQSVARKSELPEGPGKEVGDDAGSGGDITKADVPMAKPPSGKAPNAPAPMMTKAAEPLEKGPIMDGAKVGAMQGMSGAAAKTAGNPQSVVTGGIVGALKGGLAAAISSKKNKGKVTVPQAPAPAAAPGAPVAKAELAKGADIGTQRGAALQAAFNAHSAAGTTPAPAVKMPTQAEHAQRASALDEFTPAGNFPKPAPTAAAAPSRSAAGIRGTPAAAVQPLGGIKAPTSGSLPVSSNSAFGPKPTPAGAPQASILSKLKPMLGGMAKAEPSASAKKPRHNYTPTSRAEPGLNPKLSSPCHHCGELIMHSNHDPEQASEAKGGAK